MDLKEKDLIERAQRLELKEKELNEAYKENSKDRNEMDLRELHLNKRAQELELKQKEHNKAFEVDSKDLKLKQMQMKEASEALELKENEMELKEKQINERSERLELKEKEVDEHSQALELKEKKLNEVIAPMKEKEIDAHSKVLQLKEKELIQLPQALKPVEKRIKESSEGQVSQEKQLGGLHRNSCNVSFLFRNMDTNGVRSFLMKHVTKELDMLREEILNALRFAVDPPKLVLDVCRLHETNSIEYCAFRHKAIFLLDVLMNLEPIITSDVKDRAINYALTWRARLKNTRVNTEVDTCGFLLFLAVYKLASSFQANDLFKLFRALYHASEVYRTDLHVKVCFALGFLDKIPGYIGSLIGRKKRLRAVRLISVFKMEGRFPLVPLLNARAKFVRQEVKKLPNTGTTIQKALELNEKKLDEVIAPMKEKEIDAHSKVLPLKEKELIELPQALKPVEKRIKESSEAQVLQEKQLGGLHCNSCKVSFLFRNMDTHGVRSFLMKHVTKELDMLREEILNALRLAVDPPKLVLDVCRLHETNSISIEYCAFRHKAIFLLDVLMNLAPNITSGVKDGAVNYALTWRARLKNTQVNTEVDTCGFLLFLAVYKLASSFKTHDILKLYGQVKNAHSTVADAYQIDLYVKVGCALGISDKFPGHMGSLIGRKTWLPMKSKVKQTDHCLKPVEKQINEPLDAQVMQENELGGHHCNSCKVIFLFRNMDTHGVRSFLMKHVLKELDSLREEIFNALRFAVDPPKLVLDVCRLHETNSIEYCAFRHKAIFLLDVVMNLAPNITSDVKDGAINYALTWRARLKNTQVNTEGDTCGFLLFLAVYKLASSFQANDLLELFGTLYHDDDVYWTDLHVQVCSALGILDMIPGHIGSLIGRKKWLEAVRLISVFKMECRFPLVPLLNAHAKFVMQELEKLPNTGTTIQEAKNVFQTSLNYPPKVMQKSQKISTECVLGHMRQLEEMRLTTESCTKQSAGHKDANSQNKEQNNSSGHAVCSHIKVQAELQVGLKRSLTSPECQAEKRPRL